MVKRHILSIADLEPSEIHAIIDRTIQLAERQILEQHSLKNKTVGLFFRKTSTRTRTSFFVGATRLGASVIVYGPDDLQTKTGESIQDTSQVLSGYLDALVMRTAEGVEEMKSMTNQDKMSIINAMSDQEHPTQALADLAMLKRQFGSLKGLKIVYIGEGNSTAAALALAVSKMPGMSLTLFTPQGYGLPGEFFERSKAFALKHDTHIEQYHNIALLPKNVDVVYTARWQTTGSSKKDPCWKDHFKSFSITQDIMKRVSKPSGTLFMHDLPAIRGEDVTSEVLDSSQSIAFKQAHNKLFSAMAVLEWCILGS